MPSQMHDKHVYVIGASGTLGRTVIRQAKSNGLAVVGTCFSRHIPSLIRFDLCHDELQSLLYSGSRDNILILLAAHTDVNWIHANSSKADELNVEATKRIISEGQRAGCRIVFLSTELAFDGHLGGYDELSPVCPSTHYGRQKVEVEKFLIGHSKNYCILRLGAVVGNSLSDNCVVAKTYRSLLSPNAQMATDNLISVTDSDDVARAVLHCALHGKSCLYHISNDHPIFRSDLAKMVIGHSRRAAQMGYQPVMFESLSFPEPRPRQCWLSSDRLQREFGFVFTQIEKAVNRQVTNLDSKDQ